MASKNQSWSAPPWARSGDAKVAFDQNTEGDHEVLAQASVGSGQHVRVIGWQLVVTGIQTLTWKDKTAAAALSAISGVFPFKGFTVWEPMIANPRLQQYVTAADRGLVLTLGSGQRVSGDIWYELVG